MSDKTAVIKAAKQFYDRKYIESGYIAVREGDGILINSTGSNLAELKEDELVFVNDKNIESFEGNFRAAAVILFCAIRQNKTAEAAAIVDSDSILKFSSKRRTLRPILDDLAQLCGVSVKCASKNVAAEIVTSLSGQREACFMPDAGALVRARSLEVLLRATAVLDKAAYADLTAESKGACTQSLNLFSALLEHVVYRIKSSKGLRAQDTADISEIPEEEKAPQENTDSESSAYPEGEQSSAESAAEESPSADGGNADNASEDTQTDNENAEAPADCDEEVAFVKFDMEGEGTAILAHPYYCSVISAMGKPFVVPEEYSDVLGEEIPCALSVTTCFKCSGKKVGEVMGSAPACIIAQHGVVVRGRDEAEALKICASLEEACKAYLA